MGSKVEYVQQTNPNEMKIKDELVMQGMTQAAADEIE